MIEAFEIFCILIVFIEIVLMVNDLAKYFIGIINFKQLIERAYPDLAFSFILVFIYLILLLFDTILL